MRARRQAYRLAFWVLSAWWFVRRPHKRGVKCVLTDRDRVLLVRHTYGGGEWELPGGTPKRNEPAREAARREMREELGLVIDGWSEIGELRVRQYHREDTITICHAELSAPTLELDYGELAAAAWFGRDALPPDRGRHVAAILARAPR
ncbi:MAG TPA: NUDIX domain-containing protein [Solirubrobacteraceae bacterium]|jgi:8-oxo-dGTP pyrophosphatase MutT (NUDIX family)|nr:NUDIX domain-containing protein [Solirubrobacteraceae bacterium]